MWKRVVAAFNKEKALGGAFSVIAQLHRLIYSTTYLSCSADRRVTDNNVITACSSNGYNHIIFRVQTHNVCRNQQTTVAVIIGCTRRHVSTCDTRHTESWSCWSWAACCQNHAMQISSPEAALLLAFIMEMFRLPDNRQHTDNSDPLGKWKVYK